MALYIQTRFPSDLLASIKNLIGQRRIETWSFDTDGDFTHEPEQWRNLAWLRPSLGNGELKFGIVGNQNNVMTKPVYGVYHGRFAEMILIHFDTQISEIRISPGKVPGLDTFR